MAVLQRTLRRTNADPRSWSLYLRLLVVAGGAVVVIALVQVLQSSGVATTNFAIQRLEQERLEERTRVRQLEAEVAGLASLPRIEQAARERLGLEAPRARESVLVNVPPPAVEQQLPSRFAPREAPSQEAQDSAWWRDLLKILPFY